MSSEELHAVELLGRVPYGPPAASLRGMPFLALARHIVTAGRVPLRPHANLRPPAGMLRQRGGVRRGQPRLRAAELRSVHNTGTAETVRPTDEELECLGPCPRIDDQEFRPAYLRIEPRFVTVHTMDQSGEQPERHIP